MKRFTILAACAAILLAGTAPARAQQAAAGVEETRAVLAKWVETRRLISREQSDWALGQELLAERIALVRRETEAVRARIAEAERSFAVAEEERARLRAERDALERGAAALLELCGRLEARTGALLARLPERLLRSLEQLSQRLPAAAGTRRSLPLSERYLTVVGILNEIDKFQREISVSHEVRELAGGAIEVTALYVGLGQAYYVSADGRWAGVGVAGPAGWEWQPLAADAPAAAQAIAEAIAIYRGERPAAFVRLPVTIQ